MKLDLLSIDLHSFDHEVDPDGGALAGGEHALGTRVVRRGNGALEGETVCNKVATRDINFGISIKVPQKVDLKIP